MSVYDRGFGEKWITGMVEQRQGRFGKLKIYKYPTRPRQGTVTPASFIDYPHSSHRVFN